MAGLGHLWALAIVVLAALDTRNVAQNLTAPAAPLPLPHVTEDLAHHTHIHNTTNAHPRYQRVKAATKTRQPLLLISITSSPQRAHLRAAARTTWLLPCIVHPRCSYRFFIDVPDSHLLQPQHTALVLEAARHGDMVMRASCPLMSRHPDSINYGNALPIPENRTHRVPPDGEGERLDASQSNAVAGYPYDYLFRRFYKVDWKVCFLRYWSQHASRERVRARRELKDKEGRGGKNGDSGSGSNFNIPDPSSPRPYHVFIEDDSFVCTENLIHQVTLLEGRLIKMRAQQQASSANASSFEDDAVMPGQIERGRPFRTGTPSWDGFDDSSTIMSGEVADDFLKQYPQKPLASFEPVYPRTDDTPFYPAGSGPLASSELCWECPQVKARGEQTSTVWLSWGNSWRTDMCSWRKCLAEAPAPLRINEPMMQCFTTNSFVLKTLGFISSASFRPGNRTITRRHYNAETAPELFNTTLQQSLIHPRGPCQPNAPLIYHHPRAPLTLLHRAAAESAPHICERMLLIDKVKEPPEMFILWNTAVRDDYRDFSEVFLHDHHYGWAELLRQSNQTDTNSRRRVLRTTTAQQADTRLRSGASLLDDLFFTSMADFLAAGRAR